LTTPYNYIKPLLVFLAIVLLNACNPAKKIKGDEFLLNKNFIINKGTKIEKTDIESYIKLKPNRKILGFFRFHLWLNNMANEDKIKNRRIKYNKKIENKNSRRVAKGKPEKKGRQQMFGEWLLNVSETPVIYDSFLIDKSAKQLKLFLNNKGYFISTVKDSVVFKKQKKVNVYYKIHASAPYTVNNVSYKIPDKNVKQFVLSDTSNSLVSKGKNYDVDEFQLERERITNMLNNNGYYLFTQDYIYYEVDSNLNNRKINVVIGIKNYAKKLNNNNDSIIETPHQRFYIGNVYLEPDYNSEDLNLKKTDTLLIDDYRILFKGDLKYKSKVLLNTVFIRKGDVYQLQNVDDTYKRLSELKTFKSVKIIFSKKDSIYLDCYIQLSPVYKQSVTIETEGTNTSGNLGVSGSLIFQNRNLLQGAEQRLANTSSQNLTSNARGFNTIEFGPELNIYIPRFLVPFKVSASKRSNPKTVFTSALNYQQRPDYTRTITNFSFGYTWKETATKRHTFNPFVINFVKVALSPQFESDLNNLPNKFIRYSFSNHLTTSTRYSFTYNEQDFKKQKNFSYFKLNAESSGSIIRGLYNFINVVHPNTFVKDKEDRYTFLDIAYAQYLRIDADYRFYINPNEFNKVVFRIAAGIGKPLANFKVLPFERSFFSGGANGIRAWQARSLGPGSYYTNKNSYDQFGDGQLEGNIEYRFKLFKMLNGAFFVDAGNTWLRTPDATRPGGDFQLNRFYKEIAIGSGTGVRADFSFFIIRLDMGIKVRDPQFLENQRWVIQHLFDPQWKQGYKDSNSKKYNFISFNIGIGYPF
jgi:outer membrane protein assembly factor BamA